MTWRTQRIQDMAVLVNGYPFDSADFSAAGEVPLVRIRDILAKEFETFVPAIKVPSTALVRNDDVLIGMDGDFNVVLWNRGDAALNQRVCLIRTDERADARFLAYALPDHLGVINDLTYSTTVKHLSSWQILHVNLEAPDVVEQRAISDYLDQETAQIDALVAKQEEFIGLLRERRAAVIEDAVFSGVRGAPTVQYADPWLLPLAEHWSVVQLGFVTNTLAGYAFPSESFSSNTEHTRLLRGINVKPGHTDWTETVYWDQETFPVPCAYLLDDGDIVLGMDRPFVGGGVRITTISASDLPALLLQRVMKIIPNLDGSSRYLKYLLESGAFYSYLSPMFTGVSVPHMSEWQVRKFKMPFPPIDEQREIADRLDEQTLRIDDLIAKAEEHIALAKERRSALITAAVTGQFDVRTATKGARV